MKLTDRLWMAVCQADGGPLGDGEACPQPCRGSCRAAGMAAGLAVAEWLEERHGYSETAQLLRGVCES